jgi:ubiquinone/menaquinone biosynthesis C-methylase UbiE
MSSPTPANPHSTPWINSFLRFFFQQLYTTIAWTYDIVAWGSSLGKWRAWQQVGVDALPPGKILELGHGPGHLLQAMQLQKRFVAGVDPSTQMGRIARRRLKRSNLHPNLVRAQSQNLAFKDEVFDAILSTFPSEYISDPQTIREAFRVLREGGCIVIIPGIQASQNSTLQTFTLLNGINSLLGWLYRISGQSVPSNDKWGASVIQSMDAAGFETRIEEIDHDGIIVICIQACKQPRDVNSASGPED